MHQSFPRRLLLKVCFYLSFSLWLAEEDGFDGAAMDGEAEGLGWGRKEESDGNRDSNRDRERQNGSEAWK